MKGFRKQYQHAATASERRGQVGGTQIAVRLYWMLRTKTPYPEIVRIESSSRVPLDGAS